MYSLICLRFFFITPFPPYSGGVKKGNVIMEVLTFHICIVDDMIRFQRSFQVNVTNEITR